MKTIWLSWLPTASNPTPKVAATTRILAAEKSSTDAENALIVSLAASDWVNCKAKNGKSIAIERLNRVRELFFAEDVSFGDTDISLIRQSSSAKFRSYAENARWEYGDILFATINLPADNNHYLPEAGPQQRIRRPRNRQSRMAGADLHPCGAEKNPGNRAVLRWQSADRARMPRNWPS